MSSETQVSVAIIGGGVAGLTLANICEQSGISYVLWESQDRIAPPVGASIGLMPNGLRILDQIGVIDAIEEYRIPHDSWEHRDADGTLYSSVTAMRKFPEILGYSEIFMERQRVLEILYDNIQDKSHISTGKRVISVKNFPTHATVTAADGSQLQASIIVGADGVHSVVRRAINALTPSLKPPTDYLTTHVTCVYGISTPHPSLPTGRNYTIYRPHSSFLIFTGAGGALYWFIIRELPAPLPYGHSPRRFTAADIDAAAAAVADACVTTTTTGGEGGENGVVMFKDIYNRRRTAVMTPLEEGIAGRWAAGRMAIVGDAAAKMVPHAAMGANQAMESVACLASGLLRIRGERQGRFEGAAVEEWLVEYGRRREGRLKMVVKVANLACRAQLRIGEEAERYIAELREEVEDEEVWVGKMMHTFANAEIIEGWEGGSERVRFYTEQGRKWKEEHAVRA
ncbi:FAD binding domain containing protein [Lasiodiplodia theobromae]|uniref:FAD binding domain containing protein n=1 Tax=Lasiodiplodia theobromae TaxID=45133 RepID=UPI0015C30D51|nr:FAD binding domain containing protein [Lasiodiplodia theobromae]KAF4535882.1 FAD binding domain containing protein [Lasiodiplodia theobromae]